LSSALKKDAAK